MIAVTPNLTRLRDALEVTELIELSDSRLPLRSCSCVADGNDGTLSTGRLTDVDAKDTRRCVANVTGMTLVPPAGAAVTLETGANKPYGRVQVKYLKHIQRSATEHIDKNNNHSLISNQKKTKKYHYTSTSNNL